MIGIIGAMGVEVKQLKERLQNPEKEIISGIDFVSGKLGGKEVVLAACGIGKVAAAVCAQTMIIKFSPELIINSGVAGTLTKELKVGDIAIADFAVQHDMDTSPIGDPIGLISGLNIIKIPCSTAAVKLFIESIERSGAVNSLIGTVASGDQFISSAERKEFIVRNFGAIACEMECAAIAQVCYMNKVEFGAVRAISDSADDDSHVDFPKFVASAAKKAAEVAEYFVAHW